MEKEKIVLSVDFCPVRRPMAILYIIAIKFYVKYVLVGGKVASGFGADWIKTLVSMATDSSHRTIMGKTVFFHVFSVVLIQSCSYLRVIRMNIKA